MNCRGCKNILDLTFLNLGLSPIANNLLDSSGLRLEETFYPLHALTCRKCALVQLPEIASREELFREDYVYYSSYSSSWLKHSEEYVKKMVSKLDLGPSDLVLEVASNDGYLLQYFQNENVKVLGVEPAAGVASVAIQKGIPTIVDFFGKDLALRLGFDYQPRLIVANNVLAHVPDIHDFVAGFSSIIAQDGIITFEFPHLLNLIKSNLFDTIYHEHYSYLSLTALEPIFSSHDLKIVDVEKIATHGGSLRVFVARKKSNWETTDSVNRTIQLESEFDPRTKLVYETLHQNSLNVKIDLLEDLVRLKKEGKVVAAYGAAAKGNTLLNYAAIDSDLIKYVVDLNPNKQGMYLPGSRIPVVGVDHLYQTKPDVLLVLPWNISTEIKTQLSDMVEAGMKLLRALPKLEYF
jgi:SAM-dependent methyltransferase